MGYKAPKPTFDGSIACDFHRAIPAWAGKFGTPRVGGEVCCDNAVSGMYIDTALSNLSGGRKIVYFPGDALFREEGECSAKPLQRGASQRQTQSVDRPSTTAQPPSAPSASAILNADSITARAGLKMRRCFATKRYQPAGLDDGGLQSIL